MDFNEAFEILTRHVPTKRKKKSLDCELCDSDEKAVGKYTVEKQEGCAHGTYRVCSWCAKMVERQGYEVTYYKRYLKKLVKQPDCEHHWVKDSLVTQEDDTGLFDWMKCTKCGWYGRRYGLGRDGVKNISQFKKSM